MGKATKKILDGLRAAKVSSADQKRTKDLIDEAPDWNDAEASEVEAAVRFVCGVDAKLPPLSKSFLEHKASNLVHGLSLSRSLDAWDERALELIFKCSKLYWFWEVERWLDRRVENFPPEPIFEEGLALYRKHGLWKTDDDAIKALVRRVTTHVDEKGKLTSGGRWLLAQLDADAEKVFKLASKLRDGDEVKDERSSLYKLLIAHRPKLFGALLPKLELKEDSDRSYLAEVMLEADAKRFEAQAVKLVTGLKAPIPAAYSARNLEKYFGKKHLAVLKELLLATVKGKRTSLYDDGPAQDTRTLALELGAKVLGNDVVELWRAYKEENDAIRLDFYALVKKQGGAKALPFLVDGLVYPKDPNVEYGHLTYPKYIARVAALLKGFELAPYRERIEEKFAKQTNQKIKEEIASLLGKKTAKPAKAPPKKPFDPREGYRFDTYAESLVKAALAAVKKAKEPLPSPIESIKLAGHQGSIQLETLVLEGEGETVELQLAVPRSRVPTHIDDVDGGVIAKFARLHGLDPENEEEVPSWGDMYKLPWCALIHEQVAAAEAIAQGLKKQGHKLAKGCETGAGEDDNFWESAASFARMARSELTALPKAQQADFLAVCFEKRKKL